jgi:RNA polymerase sigma-70 factor (ECF subfamily)
VTTASHDDVALQLDGYRRELTGYCYRMLGSSFEAEDAVQEAMVRAWKGIDRFEGRSTLRSWLYRIATNVCLDMRPAPQRRARPMDMSPVGSASAPLAPQLPESAWLTPIPDVSVLPEGDPGEVAAARETVRLAFIAALQHLPARQRAVLVLREVLGWHADEVAELLDTSVASVNSALQRARATMSSLDLHDSHPQPVDESQQELLRGYVEAFEAYDVERLVGLLHRDVVMSMPPYPLWLRGPREMAAWFLGTGIGCKGSRILAAGTANGSAAFGSYRRDPHGGWFPWALQVIEVSGGKIVGHHNFLDTGLFAMFGLPGHLE